MISEHLVRVRSDCGLTVNTAAIVQHLICYLTTCCWSPCDVNTAAYTLSCSSVLLSSFFQNIDMSTVPGEPDCRERRRTFQPPFSKWGNTQLWHYPSALIVCSSSESDLCCAACDNVSWQSSAPSSLTSPTPSQY
jgi:hypothetical protein